MNSDESYAILTQLTRCAFARPPFCGKYMKSMSVLSEPEMFVFPPVNSTTRTASWRSLVVLYRFRWNLLTVWSLKVITATRVLSVPISNIPITFLTNCRISENLYINVQGGAIKTGPPSHCKYSEIPWPNCVEIGELLQYYMLNTVINILFKKFHRAVAPPSENTATVVYSHCTNRFEHHTVPVI